MLLTDSDALRDQAAISANERLKSMLFRMTDTPGRSATAISGLSLTRWNDTRQTDTCFYVPAIGVIVQGQKESLIGSEVYRYGELDCLVNGVDMPSISTMLDATPGRPLLAAALEIDRSLATELAAEIPSATRPAGHYLGVSVAPATADVLDTFARLVELLDKPEQIALRAPLLKREIITRVLVGPQGAALLDVYTLGSHSNHVSEAVTWLQHNYTAPLHIDALAGQVGMATSTFHRQFKKVTSISPLQYQKRLRLYEAQRLMLSEDIDANNAGRVVGYENVQQFNREYKRMFGEPPLRNIKRLRKE